MWWWWWGARQRLCKVLALLFLFFNVYSLFLYVHNNLLPITSTPTHAPTIIHNTNTPSIRFKTCDDKEEDKLVIMVGDSVSSHFLQIAQNIWTKYEDQSNKGSVSLGKRVVTPLVTKLKRFLKFNHLEHKSPRALHNLWESLHEWPFSDPLRLMSLGHVLHMSSTAKIINVTNAVRGTQLKLELTLEGGQIALWKPQWYPRTVELEGTVHGGKDRHFGEIAAFYLNLLLGYNSAPIVVGRRLDLVRDVLPVSSQLLKDTFYKGSNGSLCFYGVCHFCSKVHSVCNGAEQEGMEGALILWMRRKFKTIANPWRRTYRRGGRKAPWEVSKNYCQTLTQHIPHFTLTQTILDIVSVSVFDFLIGNGDRHHIEVNSNSPQDNSHSNKIILLDNGKSFGNAREDYVDILAPLFQCCMIRRSLYSILKRFEGQLGIWLDDLTKADPLYPLLTPAHLRALDRRLKIVLATVQYCEESIHNKSLQYFTQNQKLFN